MTESNPKPCPKPKLTSSKPTENYDSGDDNDNPAPPALDGNNDSLVTDLKEQKLYKPIPDRSHGLPLKPGMADPFEVRMRFTHQLQHLNASVTSAQKAAQYALKYKDMDEDLHSCILEQLEKNSMNNRANIMYFLEHLADVAVREGHHDYVRMMQRDILRIVDAVAPEDGSGAANVKVVRKVLQGLQAKNHLLSQTVTEIEECLKERDMLPAHIGLSSPLAGPTSGLQENNPNAMDLDSNNLNPTPNALLPSSPTAAGATTTLPTTTTKPTRQPSLPTLTPSSTTMPRPYLDKKQIEQRIEEDRERHKRLREHQWAIPFPTLPPGTAPSAYMEIEDPEFDRMWEETSSVGSDDYRLFEEEYLERKKCSAEHAEEMEALFGAAAAAGEGVGAPAPAVGGGGRAQSQSQGTGKGKE